MDVHWVDRVQIVYDLEGAGIDYRGNRDYPITINTVSIEKRVENENLLQTRGRPIFGVAYPEQRMSGAEYDS
jgi:hypothetical protein